MTYKGFSEPGLLVTPEELGSLLRESIGDASPLVVDTRPTHEFAFGHIPGAIHLDLLDISFNSTEAASFAAFMNLIVNLLKSRGIDSNRTIVFYENRTGYRVGRAYWFCEYLGLKSLRVLDGGIEAWKAEGLALTTDCEAPGEGRLDTDILPDRHIGVREVLDRLGDEGTVILDVRSKVEYLGRVALAARGGSIPGAVHVEYKRNLDSTGTLKTAEQLTELYSERGVVWDKTIVCFCQSGYRSSLTYLTLRLLGYPRVRNYTGSWQEWGNRTDLPIEIPDR